MSLPLPHTMHTLDTLEAEGFMEELERRGVTLYAVGDKVRFRPKSLLSPEDIEHLKKYKPEILRTLQSESKESAVTPVTPATQSANTDTYRESVGGTMGGTLPEKLPPTLAREVEKASELGLVARFSREEFGYI